MNSKFLLAHDFSFSEFMSGGRNSEDFIYNSTVLIKAENSKRKSHFI